jgi:hypothetical protein
VVVVYITCDGTGLDSGRGVFVDVLIDQRKRANSKGQQREAHKGTGGSSDGARRTIRVVTIPQMRRRPGGESCAQTQGTGERSEREERSDLLGRALTPRHDPSVRVFQARPHVLDFLETVRVTSRPSLATTRLGLSGL